MPSVKMQRLDTTPMALSGLQLSKDPLDDYQRYWFLAVYEMTKPGLQEFPLELETQLQISKKEYKTNTLFETGLSKVDGNTFSDKGKRGSSGVGSFSCNEYTVPDISKRHVTQKTFDPHFGPMLQLTPYNILEMKENIDENESESGRQLQTTNVADSSRLNSNITKNQEFKIIKLNARISTSMIINPNNCVIWDSNTGYVFFTGIWRLYQDIMKCLCTTDRQYQQDQSSRVHCCQEFQKVLFHVIYGKSDKPSKKESNPKWSKWLQRDSFSSYIDLHWHKLDPQLQSVLENNYGSGVSFEDMLKRIRGGYIKIQGTWLPFSVAKELCSRFCYPMRYLLVPVFGADFAEKCEYWYFQRAGISLPVSSSISPRSGESISTITSEELSRLNTAQDLLSISRRPSVYEPWSRNSVPQLHLPQTQYRSQSWTATMQPRSPISERRKSSDITLPPIQYLFDNLRGSYVDSSGRI